MKNEINSVLNQIGDFLNKLQVRVDHLGKTDAQWQAVANAIRQSRREIVGIKNIIPDPSHPFDKSLLEEKGDSNAQAAPQA